MAQPSKLSETYWVQNLANARSVFRSNSGNFSLEPYGYAGSVQEVPRAVAFDPFVKRAESRGKVKFLQPKEAMEIMEGLPVREMSVSDSANPLMRALDHGAAEATGRFVDGKDLPDEAEAGKSISFRDVWSNARPTAVQQNNRSTDTPPPEQVGPDGLKITLTEPVREGEWASDAG